MNNNLKFIAVYYTNCVGITAARFPFTILKAIDWRSLNKLKTKWIHW